MNSIINNTTANRFELAIEGKISLVEYRLSENEITFLHTEVPAELQGRGIASALAKHVLEYARANGFSVVPLCPYIAAYIGRHEEFAALVNRFPSA